MNMPRKTSNQGFTLVEMMISITLGIIVIFGIGQIFVATRTSYAAMQGLSGMQQSARFAMNQVGNAVRAGGDMGFSNNSSLMTTNDVPYTGDNVGPGVYQLTNFAAAGAEVSEILRVSSGVTVYEYIGSAPGATVTLTDPPTPGSGSADWSPPLPGFIAQRAVQGSDVIVTRYMEARNIPFAGELVGAGGASGYDKFCINGLINVGMSAVLQGSPALVEIETQPQRLYAITDTNTATIFQAANAGTTSDPKITTQNNTGVPGNVPGACGGINTTVADIGRVGAFNVEVYFVGVSPQSGEPGLWRMAFDGTGANGFNSEELVENIENMQVRIGLTMPPAAGLGSSTSATDRLETGAVLADPQTDLGLIDPPETRNNASRRIQSVRLSFLSRSEANAAGQVNEATYNVGGTTVDPVNDRRLRQVYEQNIGLRNRQRLNQGIHYF